MTATGWAMTVGVSPAWPDEDADLSWADLPDAGDWVGESSTARLSDLVPLDEFGSADIDQALIEVRRIRSQLAAFEAVLVERKAARRPAQQLFPGARATSDAVTGERPDPLDERADDWLPDELALVLQTGVTAASNLIERSCALTRQLPATWAALADARIDESRARMIVSALRDQATSHGGKLPDAAVAAIEARAVAWAESGMLPRTLKDRVAQAVLAADKDAADRTRRTRQGEADVYARPTGDGLADFIVKDLPAEDAQAMVAQTRAYAAHGKTDSGDDSPLGLVAARTAKQLILRPWEARPDTDTQIHVRVGLDDLERDLPPGSTRTEQSEPEPADTGPVREPVPPAAAPPEGWPFRAATVDGTPIPPAAVRALLARVDALGLTDPATGATLVEIEAGDGELIAAATLTEIRAAAKEGAGLGPPPAVGRYTPSPAQRRFVHARDQHCRFPGCRRPARYCDLDHVCPYTCGGATDCPNLCYLCRRHHRLKTHDPNWVFRLDADGVLHVTTPSGITRTTRPPAIGPPRADELRPPPWETLQFDTDPPPLDDPPPY